MNIQRFMNLVNYCISFWILPLCLGEFEPSDLPGEQAGKRHPGVSATVPQAKHMAKGEMEIGWPRRSAQDGSLEGPPGHYFPASPLPFPLHTSLKF